MISDGVILYFCYCQNALTSWFIKRLIYNDSSVSTVAQTLSQTWLKTSAPQVEKQLSSELSFNDPCLVLCTSHWTQTTHITLSTTVPPLVEKHFNDPWLVLYTSHWTLKHNRHTTITLSHRVSRLPRKWRVVSRVLILSTRQALIFTQWCFCVFEDSSDIIAILSCEFNRHTVRYVVTRCYALRFSQVCLLIPTQYLLSVTNNFIFYTDPK